MIEEQVVNPNSPLWSTVFLVFKIGFLIFFGLYFIFSLIVVRQVALMTETVTTEAGFMLRFLSIIFALLGLLVLVFFIFFL